MLLFDAIPVHEAGIYFMLRNAEQGLLPLSPGW